MVHFACPKCNSKIIILEFNSKRFKWLVVCVACLFYGWISELKELTKDPKNDV